jgi:hypothetical protein
MGAGGCPGNFSKSRTFTSFVMQIFNHDTEDIRSDRQTDLEALKYLTPIVVSLFA